jgi:hypothetical protein
MAQKLSSYRERVSSISTRSNFYHSTVNVYPMSIQSRLYHRIINVYPPSPTEDIRSRYDDTNVTVY